MRERLGSRNSVTVAPRPPNSRGLFTLQGIAGNLALAQATKLRPSWRFNPLTAGALSGDVRCNECEGLSPNALRYSTEKRPSSTKPKDVAISVTVADLQSADKRALLAWDSRNIRSCRHGGTPWVL